MWEDGWVMPDAAWHEIRPHLWMGGHQWLDPARGLCAAVAEAEFDLVVSLIDEPGHGPAAGVEHHVLAIPDGPLTDAQLAGVVSAAARVAAAVRAERSTLVRCRVGFNRSGLVVALALVELGLDPAAAIELVRARRSARSLNNSLFVQYLYARLGSSG
jgi:protein-tyrosine phosphatase